MKAIAFFYAFSIHASIVDEPLLVQSRKANAQPGYTPLAYMLRLEIKKVKQLLGGNRQICFGEVADK